MKSITSSLLLCLLSSSAFAHSSFDGYWVSPQLSYALKASDDNSFCERLTYSEYSRTVSSFPSVIKIENNKYSVCSLTKGKSWRSSCNETATFFQDGLLNVPGFETQYTLAGENVMEVVYTKTGANEMIIDAGSGLNIRTTETALDKFAIAAYKCEKFNKRRK